MPSITNEGARYLTGVVWAAGALVVAVVLAMIPPARHVLRLSAILWSWWV
jgi:hypothetical protein